MSDQEIAAEFFKFFSLPFACLIVGLYIGCAWGRRK